MRKALGKRNKRQIILVCLAAVAVASALVALMLLYFNHRATKHPETTASQNSKGEVSANTQDPKTSDDPDVTQPGDEKSGTGSSGQGGNLIAPSTDSLVSNHHPNLSGQPAPNTLSSVCTTTPGATCTISFQKDSITKSLPKQTTDRGGSTYWNNWSLQDIGLSAGTWKIVASAELNGQIKNASDAMDLVVSQ